MTIDKEQFYSTPLELAEKLVGYVKLIDHHSTILEPSAGEGALLDALKRHDSYYFNKEYVHCVEINPKRTAILKGNGYNVIWDDFLTFNPPLSYDVILMNPPFNEGSKHLLKALSVCAPGGQIACILNAETIENPYSNERKQLLKILDQQESWDYEIVENAFANAERKTNVTVALVYVKMKAASGESIILNHFKKFVISEREKAGDQAVTRYGEIEQLIDRHHAEVMAALALFDEINNYNAVALEVPSMDEVFKIECGTNKSSIVRKINLKYWKVLFHCDDIRALVTSKVASEYQYKVYDMADFDFNERNILQLKEDLIKNLFKNIEDAIEKVFDEMTYDYSCEKTDNIHYYNGWKTNKAFFVNKKVILPMYAFGYYSGGWTPYGKVKPHYSFESSRVQGKIDDIETVMNHLDGGRTREKKLFKQLAQAQLEENYKNIDTKYFLITFYKKGTAHFTFKDDELRKKFNIYAGRKKNWLPPSYGKKPYDEMDDEEKAVIDSFEGKEAYEETYAKRDFYITDGSVDNNLLMLNGAS